jgi:type IV secretion system protein VirB9
MIRLLLMAFFAMPAYAQISPQPGEGDPRIQSVEYNPAQIIRLSVAPGLQTMVELGAGEVIQTIGVGDSASWQVSAGKRGDFFFIKNINANALTNVTVVTAGRVYNFEVVPSGGYGDISPYHVKLTYPARAKKADTVLHTPSFRYDVAGARSIRPSRVYQDGTRTLIEWPEERALPAVFIFENGQEALVNGEMQDGRFILSGTPETLVFRLDRKRAYAKRRSLIASEK